MKICIFNNNNTNKCSHNNHNIQINTVAAMKIFYNLKKAFNNQMFLKKNNNKNKFNIFKTKI